VSTQLLRKESPEELEIEAKRIELAALEARFGEQELALATAHAEVRSFERRYIAALGILFAELDRIEAEIAQIEARLHPRDPEKQTWASDAEARAEESAQAAREAQSPGPAIDFAPSDDLKKLYRQAAMRIHPDLCSDPQDAPHRERVMAEVNDAYDAGDEARLRRILEDWDARPESVTGDGPGAKLIRLIRKIAQVKVRLAALDSELKAFRESELAQLKAQADRAAAEGQDLLADMGKNLKRQIREAKVRLSELRHKSAGRKA